MPEASQKLAFPTLPVTHWWGLRGRFRRSIPGVVSAKYLASVLSMTERLAQRNVIPSLRSMGLIDESGRPTDLAVRWRDDEQYPGVCKSILDRVYPEELRDIGSDGSADRSQIARWFANHTGGGESNTKKLAAMYMTLCKGDADRAKNLGHATEKGIQGKPAKRPSYATKTQANTATKSDASPTTHALTAPARRDRA